MQRAADILVGTHDFAAFQASKGRKSTVRTLYRILVGPLPPTFEWPPLGGAGIAFSPASPHGDASPAPRISSKDPRKLCIVLEGEGFLYKQCRNVAGELICYYLSSVLLLCSVLFLHTCLKIGQARRFQRHSLVFLIPGTLFEVGFCLRSVEDVRSVLESRRRERAGPTMPAKGLCLEHVEYERDWTSEAKSLIVPLKPTIPSSPLVVSLEFLNS